MKTYKLYSLFGGKIDTNHYLAYITWIYIPTFDYDSLCNALLFLLHFYLRSDCDINVH